MPNQEQFSSKQAKWKRLGKEVLYDLIATVIVVGIGKLIECLLPAVTTLWHYLNLFFKILIIIVFSVVAITIRRWLVAQKYRKGRARLKDVNRIAKQHRHPVLFQTVCDYLHHRVVEITKHHALMNVSEYIDVLLASIRTRPSFVFATCVLTPDEWYNGTFHQSIQSYFEEQKTINKQSPGCQMYRVILVDPKQLLEASSSGSHYKGTVVRLINEHILAGIKIGLADRADYVGTPNRDFALYGDNDGAWAVEAHGLHAAGAMHFAKVQLHECRGVNELLSVIDRFSGATLPQDLKIQLMTNNPAITAVDIDDCTIIRFKERITDFVTNIRNKN